MSRALRTIAITLGLAIAGALAGGMASLVALKLSLSMAHDAWAAEAAAASSTLYSWFFDNFVILGLAYGIPFGAVIAPLMAWVLLRHVPIAQMFLWCTCSTVAGSVIGWITTSGLDDQMSGGLAGGLIGCLVGAVLLGRRYAHPLSSKPTPSE
jgi:hypothetical protein